MKQNKTACVVYYTDNRYDELAENVKNSFLKWNGEECDFYQIDYTNQKQFNSELQYFEFAPETFLMQYIYAYEIMKSGNYEKIIVLGTDTIVCSRLDEFLDDDKTPILATLNYPCQESTEYWVTPFINGEHYNLNADVICFNSDEALKEMIELSIEHYTSFSIQGGLNEILYQEVKSGKNNEKIRVVDAPYSLSEVVYNCRSKGVVGTDCIKKGKLAKLYGNMNGQPSPIHHWYVKDNKLFTHDNKQIKVFHFVEGLGGRPIEIFNELIDDFKTNWFNEETKQFFRDKCGCQEFFN
jgi:hypothetical protein